MCRVLEANVDTPRTGVDQLFAYLAKNTPEMAGQWGELLVAIERIPDDRAHDRRALRANRRFKRALQRCARTAERFADALDNDPVARERLEKRIERLGRALEPIFSGAEAELGLSAGVRRLLR